MTIKSKTASLVQVGILSETASITSTNYTPNLLFFQGLDDDCSASNQRQALLSFIRKHGSITTLEARQLLGICAPAARVLELRARGYAIETVFTDDIDSTGKIHRVARYILAGKDADSVGGQND